MNPAFLVFAPTQDSGRFEVKVKVNPDAGMALPETYGDLKPKTTKSIGTLERILIIIFVFLGSVLIGVTAFLLFKKFQKKQ